MNGLNQQKNRFDWCIMGLTYLRIDSYPAMVAWSVRASGNNTGPWKVVDGIQLEACLYGQMYQILLAVDNSSPA